MSNPFSIEHSFTQQSDNATFNCEGDRVSIVGVTNKKILENFRFMNPAVNLILDSLITFITLYSYILIVRILLSWFQTAEWANNIISFLSPITDPYLNIFRSVIPPLGGIDFSAILAILALQLVQGAFEQALF